ncbi:MAG: hypothetical protein GY744_10195 [Gammaproteobacteria bacterium]|nr:hypothetical protein [Gammaproteobacteria bacterium]
MRNFLAILITAFTFLFIGHASAATSPFNEKSLDSLNSPLVCADEEEKKKKKKNGEEEEPECE